MFLIFDNTIFDYLQTLAKELKWQRINSENIGYPVSGKGGNTPNNKIVSFEDIKIDVKNTTNPAYTRTNYNYDSSLRSAVNKIESGKAMDLAWINQDEAEALLYLKHLIETDSIDENNKAINEDLYIQAFCNDNRVRIRKQPNLNCETLGYLNKGDKVYIKGNSEKKQTIDNESWYWNQVELPDGTTGWV